jgi:sterol desaturase/sphingolipid hydroxylase (fatty acid hydroxylase superfamily)
MLEYLGTNGNTVLFAALVGTFILAALWEAVQPRRRVTRDSVRRWVPNISLGLANHLLVYWIDAVAAIGITWWLSQWGVGLFTRIDPGFPVILVTTVLAFELLGYLVHYLLHRFPWLWRIHVVHHSDTELDFTSTYRNHPLELLLVSAATFPLIAVLGPPVVAVTIYQVCRVSVNILSHSNVYLPESMDRWLRYVIVTPDFHRCHHCAQREFTDSNYGSVLTLFDYLFGTASRKPFVEHSTMKIGLHYFRDKRDSRFDQLLLMPFRHLPADTEREDRQNETTLQHS